MLRAMAQEAVLFSDNQIIDYNMAMTIIERILQAYKANDIAFFSCRKHKQMKLLCMSILLKNFQHVDDFMNQMKTVSFYSL
jgi:hypothetical protein